MKKIFKLAVLAAMICGFVFSGCKNNLVDDDSYYSSTNVSTDTSSRKTIIITATADEGLISFSSNNSSRTILPEQVDQSNLTFFLGHKKKGDTDFVFYKVNFDADATDTTGCTGTVEGTFDLASYEFKLYAVETTKVNNNTTLKEITLASASTPKSGTEGTIKNNAIFAGYAASDLRYADSVAFYLSSNSLSATGTWDIDIKSDWVVPSNYKVTAEIRQMDKDIPVSGSKTEIKALNVAQALNSKLTSANGVTPGTYNLVITILDNKTSKEAIYSEKIIILPNRVSKGLINVPDITDSAPTRPADLIVGYTNPATSDLNYYNTVFGWTDTSYCERGFKLQIALVDHADAILTPTSDATWDALLATKLGYDPTQRGPSTSLWGSTDEDDSTFDTYVLELTNENYSQYRNAILPTNDSPNTGCLNMNNNHVTLMLPVGHRFVARICSWNDIADSDWTYLDLSKDETSGSTKDTTTLPATSANGTTGTAQATTPSATLVSMMAGATQFDADVTTINRYKITYNLVGGKFEDADASLTDADMPAGIVFESQHNTDANTATLNASKVAILKPDADTSASPATGTDNTYIDKSGATQTDVKLVLSTQENGDKYYWSKWKKDSTTNTDDYTDSYYKGYDNLHLFAIYNTDTTITPPVVIENVNKYDLKKNHIKISLYNKSNQDATANYITDQPEDGGAADGVITLADCDNPLMIDSNVGSVQLAPTTDCYKYDRMHLVVTRVNNNLTIVDQDISNTGWTINVGSYRTGKYIIEITAQTSRIGKATYSLVSVFEIVDDLSIAPKLVEAGDSITLKNTNNVLSIATSPIYTESITYQWTKDGANIAGATSSTYTILATETTDAEYKVTIRGGSSGVSCTSAGITTKYTAPAPVYNMTGAADITNSGNVYTMNVSGVTITKDGGSYSPSWTYVWTYSDGVGGTTMPGTVNVVDEKITVSGVSTENGIYTCKATDATSGKFVTKDVTLSF